MTYALALWLFGTGLSLAEGSDVLNRLGCFLSGLGVGLFLWAHRQSLDKPKEQR